MTTVTSWSSSVVTAATSITVDLGGAPNVGDLAVVWIGTSNQIIVQPPGYNGTNQWFKAGGLQGYSSKTALHMFYHTYNSSDTAGEFPVFTFSPAPSLGVGDTDLSSASAVAVGVVVAGPTGVLDYSFQGGPPGVLRVPGSPQKRAANLTLTGAYTDAGNFWSDSDPSSFSLISAFQGTQVLTVFTSSAPTPAGYSPVYTVDAANDATVASLSFSDSGPQVYNPPVIQESPVANDDPLFMRYKLGRYYTVLNNAGVYTAQRYLSTDQVNAATAVYTNNAPVTSAIRTAILNSGVGGEFRATA